MAPDIVNPILRLNIFLACYFQTAFSLPPLLSDDAPLSLNRSYINFYQQPQDTVAVKTQSIILNCEIGFFSIRNVPINKTITADVTWFKNDKKLIVGGVFTRKSLLANGSLSISKAIHNPDGDSDNGLYMCQAKYRLKIFRSRKARVKVAVFNRNSFQQASRRTSIGSYIHFNCTFMNADPNPVIAWYRNGYSIGSNSEWHLTSNTDWYSQARLNNGLDNILSPSSMLNADPDDIAPFILSNFTTVLPNGALEISSVSLNDAGDYYCTGRNPARARKTNTFSLSVTSERSSDLESSFAVEPSSKTVVVGDNAFFQCAVTGLTKSLIKWFKGTKQIDFGSSTRQRLVGQGSLLIEDCVSSDEGEYSCLAESVNPPLVTTARLSVLEPPYFTNEPKHIQYAHLGCEISFLCNATGTPIPSVTWYKDGVLLSDSVSIKIEDGKLFKRITSRSDEGVYQCFALNDVGQTQATHQLVIITQDSAFGQIIGLPENNNVLRLEEVTSNHADLSWPQFGLAHPSGYRVMVQNLQENSHKVLRSRAPRISLDGLQPGNLLRVTVVPYTLLCDGPSSKELTFTVRSTDTVTGTVQNFAADAVSPDSIFLTWEPPAGTKTKAGLRYKVLMEEIAGEDSLVVERIVSQTSFKFENLKKSTSYGFKVAVIDPAGPTETFTSQILSKTQDDMPDSPPANFSVVSESSNSAFLRWDPPLNTSVNGELHGYRIRYKDVTNGKTYTAKAPAGSKQWTLTNLRRNTEYTVRIQTVNNVGQSPFSHKLRFETPKREKLESSRPGQPGLLNTQRSADEIIIMWAPPVGNVFVREYVIAWGSTDPYEHTQKIDGKQRFFRITNLEPSTQYFISVRAGNAAGLGMEFYTDAHTKAVEDSITELFPPLGVHVDVLTDTTLNVSWHDSDVNKVSRYYVVRYKTNVPNQPRVRYINATDLNCLIHGLRPHTLYEIAVKVVQGNRKSTWSMTEAAITKESKPGSAPTDLTVMPLEGQPTSVQLNWQPPEEPNGELNGYLIFFTTDQSNPIDDWVVEPVIGEKLSTSVDHLTLDTQYYFKSLASNSHGSGPYSEVVEYRTPKGAQKVHATASTSKMPYWMWYVIIGVVSLFVLIVVLIATVMICRNKSTSRKSSNRQQMNGNPRTTSNGIHSLPGDSWPRSAQSNVSAQSMRLLHPDEQMEIRSLRTTDGRYMADFPKYQMESEFTPLNADPYRNYPYPSRHSNLNDLIRSPANSEIRQFYPTKGQYGNGMIPMSNFQQSTCEMPPYDLEFHQAHSSTTTSPQDYTGDSAYGSDHQHHHPVDDLPSGKHGRTSSSRKHNQYYQDKQAGKSRSIPSSESLDSARSSGSMSVASEDMNHELANVEAFVRDMKASQAGISTLNSQT